MAVSAHEFDFTSKEVTVLSKIYHRHLQILFIRATTPSGLALC